MVRPSPLQLEFTFFPVIRVEAIPSYQETSGPKTLDFKLEITHRTTALDESGLLWESYLEVKSMAEVDVPYRFEIHSYGRFGLPEESPADVRCRFVESNAPAILYAGIREMLMNLTGRGPFTRIQLAPLQFVPDAKVEQPS